jgi:hypothetical protein
LEQVANARSVVDPIDLGDEVQGFLFDRQHDPSPRPMSAG